MQNTEGSLFLRRSTEHVLGPHVATTQHRLYVDVTKILWYPPETIKKMGIAIDGDTMGLQKLSGTNMYQHKQWGPLAQSLFA